MENKIAIKVTSPEHGATVIKYLESLGGVNHYNLRGINTGYYYCISSSLVLNCTANLPENYTEAFLPEDTLPDPSNFRAKAALMCLSFYEVEDEERFSKAVRDADDLIRELNK